MSGITAVIVLVVVIWIFVKLSNYLSKSKQVNTRSWPAITIKIRHSHGRTGRSLHSGPKSKPVDCWISRGQQISIHGKTIPGGLLYLGSNLADCEGYDIEPALIDPSLSIDFKNPDVTGSSMPYWPRYGDISPQARAGYINWLVRGRREPGAYIGLVFLFFYGLERRLLVDRNAIPNLKQDASDIAQEVRTLLNVYGSNGSFRSYATRFLNWIALEHYNNSKVQAAIQGLEGHYEMPIQARITLGLHAVKNEPIPADLALTWVKNDPKTRLGMPVKRCSREFEALFKMRYGQKHGKGILVKPNKTPLTVDYRPASGGISHEVRAKPTTLPDLTVLKAPVEKIRMVAKGCADELSSYSRAVGRRDDLEKRGLREIGLLPPDLLKRVKHTSLLKLRETVEKALNNRKLVPFPFAKLITLYPTQKPGQFSKKEHTSLAVLLQSLGYGIEPDPRFGTGRLKPDEPVILFRMQPGSPTEPREAYHAATFMLQLAAAVAISDGTVSKEERIQLANRLNSTLHLEPSERRRLQAHLAWQTATPTSFAGVAKRVEPLKESQRLNLGEFLVTIAGADGVIEPAEVRMLEKIFKLLKLSPEQLYSSIHQFEALPANEPIVVRDGLPRTKGLAIPPKPKEERAKASQPTAKVLKLDEERIRRKMDDTRAVQSILKDIFETDEQKDSAQGEKQELTSPFDVAIIPGLDSKHSILFNKIAGCESIAAADLEEMCEELGLMMEGAVEVLNDAAFDITAEALIEDGDPFILYPDVADAMLGSAGKDITQKA